MKEQLISLCNDDALEISFAPGSGKNAVVSFAGIGLNFGGMQTEEFAKSLESTTSDVYYVKDKLRHWYTECADKIVEIVNRHLQARNIANTTCIGNSMGGFGAVYFAPRLLNCRNAIAFVPQSSINTRLVPWETRWKEWRAGLVPGEGLDAVQTLDPGVSYTIITGLKEHRDILHVRRLITKAPDSMIAIGLPKSGHGAAAHLKRESLLKPFLRALLAGQKEAALTALQETDHEILNARNIKAFVIAARTRRDKR
jgi:pimeloyl-ACP methyl ester carboxylesterase